MRKIFRTSAAVLLTGMMLAFQAVPAMAEEGYGPGYQDSVPQTEAASGEQTQETGTQTVPAEGEAQDQEAAAALEAEKAAAEAAEAALRASLPQFQTTLLIPGGVWSQPFVNDQIMTLGEMGFRSISTFMTNTVGNLLYRTYTSAHGWSPWVMNGQATTAYEDGSLVEAVQMKLEGPVANNFDLYYTSILSDGTETGWASNGQTSGTMGQGKLIYGFRLSLYGKGETWPYSTENRVASEIADGIQYVDGQLRYYNGNGTEFTGWGYEGNERYYFVNSIPVTGWQYIDGYKLYFDEAGKLVKDLEPVIGKQGAYEIRINKEMNTTTIYAKDGANGYIIPVKSFLCSTGDDTPLGTFRTPEKYRWRLMNSGVYAQYATRLHAGKSFLLHSIIYDLPNNMTLWPSTYNYLGVARSAGCIRYLSSDAKWIYDNCPIGTAITVYNSADPGPYGRPVIPYTIPETQTWDPTDVTVTGV